MNETSPLANFIPELERLADEVTPEQAPALLGDLERIRSRIWARMTATATQPKPSSEPKRADRLLSAEEAAKILGVKPRWLRDNAEKIGGRTRLPGKHLRFSERKLRRWIEQRTT